MKAYRVDHAPVGPALSYRVEYGGRVIGISGDTVDTEGLRNLASGADALVSEVLDPTFTLELACAFERSDLFRGQGNGSRLTKSVDRGDSHRYDIGVTYPNPALCFLS